MNTQFEQEIFTYYKEGVITWIYLNETDSREVNNSLFPWQEQESRLQDEAYMPAISRREAEKQNAETGWFSAVAEKSYGHAEAGYWDTG